MISKRYDILDENAECHKLVLTSEYGIETVIFDWTLHRYEDKFIYRIISKREKSMKFHNILLFARCITISDGNFACGITFPKL